MKVLIAVAVAAVVLLLVWLLIYGKKGTENFGEGEQQQEQVAAGTLDRRSQPAMEVSDYDKTVAGEKSQLGTPAAAADIDRKIIKTGKLELDVDDLDASVEQVMKLAREAGGFVAAENFYSSRSGERWCEVTIRVPSARFDAVLIDLKKHGEVTHAGIETQDVTEEFIDLEARLRNLQREEGVLLDLLERRTQKLADVLEVERELSRVRGEIEQAEGRLRYLKNRVSLSTIDIRLTEIGAAAVGPPGKWRLRLHARSAGRLLLTVLRGASTAILYIAVVGAPLWLILLIWLGVRRVKRRRRG